MDKAIQLLELTGYGQTQREKKYITNGLCWHHAIWGHQSCYIKFMQNWWQAPYHSECASAIMHYEIINGYNDCYNKDQVD